MSFLNGLRYSIINMDDNNDNSYQRATEFGVVTTVKNVPLLTVNVSEKLSVVKHSNGRDYWVVTAEKDNNNYHVFLLNAGGLVPFPVQSIGPVISGQGVMKHSPDGSRLAVANLQRGTGAATSVVTSVCVFHFDNTTGLITNSNIVSLSPTLNTNGRGYYGVEFSPNSNMLYFGRLGSPGEIYQKNLRQTNPAFLIGTIPGVDTPGSLQLSPESPQRIIIANRTSLSLSVINNPNTGGVANFQLNAITLSNQCRLGLPGFVSGAITTIDSSAYCCDESPNLIINGNFEAGNNGFRSYYTPNTTPFPGMYNVGNSAGALTTSSQWNVQDHSSCAGIVSNSQFLMVNGKTQQSAGSESIIWEQAVNLAPSDPNEPFAMTDYRLCANFKNLAQCAFDVEAEIEIRIGGQTSGWKTISTSSANPCDWQLENFLVSLRSAGYLIQIVLKEDGNGDGNDLAIDDISLQELKETGDYITVQNNGGSNIVTASLNDITALDDSIQCDSNYSWYIEEITSWTPTSYTFSPASQAQGNMAGNNISGSNAPWNLTTTFPGYTFANNKMYVVAFYQPANEDCCQAESLTYQIILNSRSVGVLSEAEKQRIIIYIKTRQNTGSTSIDDKLKAETSTSFLKVYPNPATNVLNVNFSNKTMSNYKIYNSLGQVVINSTNNEVSHSISIEKLTTGSYLMVVTDEENIPYSAKFVKM